ncbi:MAG: OsmC family protein [Desulfobacteraceae bacterium]|nr:OsmC family protein [Desulfobacteraceae bacterium]
MSARLPNTTTVSFTMHSEGTGVCQDIKLEGSAHVIHVDAAPAFGGKDRHPSPLAYGLGALLSCSQVTAQQVAKDLGIELRSFEFDLTADLDTAILVGGAMEGNPNFQNVGINAIVDTDAPDDVFSKFYLETERRCPMTQLFSRSGASIKYRWSKRADNALT